VDEKDKVRKQIATTASHHHCHKKVINSRAFLISILQSITGENNFVCVYIILLQKSILIYQP
jgi:hypothetical protein